MKLINRNEYLYRLIDVVGTPDIKVITGVRRSGKSKLLELLKKHIKETMNDYNIVEIDYNLLQFDDIKNYKSLNEYVEERYVESKVNFIMIDEVQMCEKFELAINSFHASGKYDIYITGSNAFLLSSDLVTLFTGRTFQIEVYPFSFKEYVNYYNLTNIDAAFDSYFLEGGLSGSYLYKNIVDKYDYINKDIYETIIIKDLMTRHNIRNKEMLENLCSYLIDNISNFSSANSITNYLNTNNDASITNKTISNYIDYLCDAYIFYKVSRYDLRGKKYLSTDSKYYLCDHVIKYAKLGKRNIDYGRSYENIVAIELLRRGYKIYAGKLYQKEVDFVAVKRDEKIYIQVSMNIDDKDTFKREIAPLEAIKDSYPKMIITRNKHEEYTYEGIMIVDIARWLSK